MSKRNEDEMTPDIPELIAQPDFRTVSRVYSHPRIARGVIVYIRGFNWDMMRRMIGCDRMRYST